MIEDLTFEVLERAVGSLLPASKEIALACDFPFIDDNYEGYIVQAKHLSNDVLTNDGKVPVVGTYEVEITYATSDDIAVAREVNQGASMKSLLALNMKDAIISHLPSGAHCEVYHVSSSSNDVTITESNRYVYSTIVNLSITPILGQTE